MTTQSKVGLDKQKHPERYCSQAGCLWKVVKLDHATQTFHPRPDCPGGRCPRHQRAVLAEIKLKEFDIEWDGKQFSFTAKHG